MAKRRLLIDKQALDESGKIVRVSFVAGGAKADVLRAPTAAAGIPSAVGIQSAAGGSVSMEIADDLVIGVGVSKGDRIVVRFILTQVLVTPLSVEEIEQRVTPLFDDAIIATDDGIAWTHTFVDDVTPLDLFELSAEVAHALGIHVDAGHSGISFVIDSYTSAVDDRIATMTGPEQKVLACSMDATPDELSALIKIAEPGTQISAITNPHARESIVRKIANSGPFQTGTAKNAASARTNRMIQEAASTELARRARKAKRKRS